MGVVRAKGVWSKFRTRILLLASPLYEVLGRPLVWLSCYSWRLAETYYCWRSYWINGLVETEQLSWPKEVKISKDRKHRYMKCWQMKNDGILLLLSNCSSESVDQRMPARWTWNLSLQWLTWQRKTVQERHQCKVVTKSKADVCRLKIREIGRATWEYDCVWWLVDRSGRWPWS